MTQKPKTIGEQIRDVRLAAGMTTQQMLVDAINKRRPTGAARCKQSHLSAMENDHHSPSRGMLEEIAAATGHVLQGILFLEP